MLYKKIEKNFNHKEVEKKIYHDWYQKDLFKPDPLSKKEKISIMMPPPNVTGTLHIGHALNMTVQDIMVRYWRMNNKDVLWQPGTDHAGIATQKIVESNLKKKNINKNKLGKSKFLQEVWDWKENSGRQIINQIKRLGASPDWSRERFTLDEDMSNAVRHVFIDLFNKGLIYKDKRLINWDINLQTAVSDLEVEQIEKKGEFVYLKYYNESKSEYIEVATTRPETLFGDQCLSVNPKDRRYANLIGSKVYIPLTNILIPIIADKYVDMKKGSGVLKITPAHDFNDYKIGVKNNLVMKVIFDKFGKFNKNVPYNYQGKDRLKARFEIIEELKEKGFIKKIKKINHTIPIGDRSGTIIEPYLTDQWFLNVKSIATEVVKKVKNGETKFFPSSWTKTFFTWMNEIEPWCISRQIWWGHKIPVWYGPDKKIIVAKNEEEANDKALKIYKKKVNLIEETDVLDTWFSSALWPMSTLGWPNEENIYYKKYFPTNLLVTGFDIIFFWVARMMMQSTIYTNKLPFKEIYIHALVRDKDGQKMSKSKGNVIDPIKIIDIYGADPLRFSLSYMAAQGRDIKLSEDAVKINRNFITKIRNAYNFLQINNCFEYKKNNKEQLVSSENIWLLKLTNDFIKKTNINIKTYKFNEVAKDIYKFTKNIFCDWYLEFLKVALDNKTDSNIKNELKACSTMIFKVILKVAHPIIPFITDDLYVNYIGSKNYLIEEEWPKLIKFNHDKNKVNMIENLLSIITKLRNIKATLKIEPKDIIEVYSWTNIVNNTEFIQNNKIYIDALARINIKNLDNNKKDNLNKEYLKFVFKNFIFYIKKNNMTDISSVERKDLKILQQQLVIIDEDIASLNKKILNKEFIKKAPKEVIKKFKEKMNEKVLLKNKIANQIKSYN